MSLTNKQIDHYYRSNPLWGGCADKYVVDEEPLRSTGPNGRFYIFNMARETKSGPVGGGSHWFLVFDCPIAGSCVYFDTYGLDPPPEIKAFCEKSKRPCVRSDIKLESIDGNTCGEFCIIVANKLLQGFTLEEILLHHFDPYSPRINGELVAEEWRKMCPNERDIVRTVHSLSKTIEGRGFLTRIKQNRFVPDFIKKRIHTAPRETEPARFKKLVEEQGQSKIKSITIGQEPVIAPVQKFLNVISLGKYNSVKRRLKYSDVVHEYANIELENGKTYRVETNAVAAIKQVDSPKSGSGKHIEIPLSSRPGGPKKDLNLNTFINNASGPQGTKENRSFWQYSSRDANCQQWQEKLLERNGLMPTDPIKRKELEPQDSHKLLDTIPERLRFIPQLATDIAGTADRIVHGD